MPLPVNSNLSLLGASRPGDALPSKPKKAMFVRMSSEVLDALEASVQPQLQFEFGENSAIYIGDSCFPMIHSQENAIHELYLRAASAAKKNAPLKLYANVVGRFTVEHREIGNDLRDKIRESTQDAVAQKNSRATVFMETPPETVPMNKKRKEPPMFHRPLRPSDKPKPAPNPPTSTPPSRPTTSTLHSSTGHQGGGVPVRKRLVQCLAKGDKPEDELFKLLGASDRNSSFRAQIFELLDELAELKPLSDKSLKVYKLKPIAWKEVRPFEWPGLSEQERIQMARTGRLTLKNLRIPESDPLWTHFRYKSSTTAALTNNSSSSDTSRASTSNAVTEDRLRPTASDAPKRGVSSREIKEKKTKPKPDPKAEIKMKDESQRASLRPPPADSSRDASTAPSIRRQPPSSARPTKPPARQEESSNASARSSTSQAERPKPQDLKRVRENDIHPSDSEKGRIKPKDRVRQKELQDEDSKAKPMKKKVVQDVEPKRPIRRTVDDDYQDSKGSLKRKAKEDTELPNPKKRRAAEDDDYVDSRGKSSKQKARDVDEYVSVKSNTKRKAVEVDDDFPEPVRQKKHKPDRDSISSTISSSRDDRQRKESLVVKKTMTESRVDDRGISRDKAAQPSTSKTKKASPPPAKRIPPSNTNGREADYRRTSTASASSTKPTKRRKSPVYTSTEDEKEDEPSSKQPVRSSVAPPASSKAQTTKSTAPRPLSSPSDDLRIKYNSIYVEYLTTMQQVLVQKGKLESLLKSADLDNNGSVSESDGDVEVLPFEELQILNANHKGLQSELQAMLDEFERRKVKKSTSD